jgi:diketogulonate reductase-like aldo/keto reductase
MNVRGVRVPGVLYGTAWKEDATEACVVRALDAGFRGIDTANQRKHYVELDVGAAVAASKVPREELFLQTKFTYARGQDRRLPYDAGAPIARQVEQSFESSCDHLGVDTIDSYLLHGPWSDEGWQAQDREAWGAMEALQTGARASLLGVSNVSHAQLAALLDETKVPVAFVQNRCYARTGWDREVRALCRANGIVYQGFSLLTANRKELAGPTVTGLAQRLGASVPQVIFRFAQAVGMLPLTGTSSRAHMEEDLAASALTLDDEDVRALETVSG